ncbi:ATPase, T2SS/T4P/T4SS family [Desulfogranum japonicum]|uniref:ATPase, T2SS/T4P/T4SS family n=1 Tax=Desulfogranum japonicum TaxID=231447 RepID=UPI0012947B72|nr:ATPase, T2SS/T4P/T4SS family [Desulfogranum japonicum]
METRRGSIFAVTSAKGGVGKSVFAANFAFALYQETKSSILLLDMNDTSCGDTAHAAGLSPFDQKTGGSATSARGIIDLMNNIHAITPRALLASFAPAYEGVTILNLKARGEENRKVPVENIGPFLDVASRAYGQVVVDLGAGYSNPITVACLERSNAIFVLLRSEMFSISQTIKGLEALQQLSFQAQMIYPVLSGYSRSNEFSPSLIEARIRRDLFTVIPQDEGYFSAGLKVNRPALLVQPRHPVSKALGNLAATLWRMDLCEPQIVGVQQQTAPVLPQQNVESSGQAQVPVEIPQPTTSNAELDDLKLLIHQRLFGEVDLKALDEQAFQDEEARARLREQTKAVIDRLVDEEAVEINDRKMRMQISQEVLNEAIGLGPLESLLEDPAVTEIMCNGPSQIYVEKKGKITLTDRRFLNDRYLRATIDRIVGRVGRRIDEMSPMVDARLEDGSRVNAVIPPLAADGSLLTIRKFSKQPLQVDDLINLGSFTWQMAELLKLCVQSRLNIIISGGTGSGKTTLLNVLSSFIPEDERIVTIEDAAELQLHQEHVCRLESRPENIEGKGEITIRDLVKNSLRMRPDRIVVGECRGGESIDMLQAMNTGHDGSMTTVHANNVQGALRRLETLVMFSGLELPSRAIREQIASACDIIIQQNRQPDGSRKIETISEVTGIEGDVITTQEIFTYRNLGYDEERRTVGEFVASGLIPNFISELEDNGQQIPRDIFM